MERSVRTRVLLFLAIALLATSAIAKDKDDGCGALPDAGQLRSMLQQATNPAIGGLFNGSRMWAAVVNRDGVLCALNTSTVDPTQVWPGSRAISIAKAFTANAFSLDTLALSTARLYTFTQPGHSLNSLGQSNPFDQELMEKTKSTVTGGMIFFGGGLPLYKDGKIVGGLGVSGDTSCADHEVAKKVRTLAGLDPPAGLGGALGDDIVYSPPDPPSVFAHPVCLNTKRNGIAIGDEMPVTYPRVPPI